MGKYDSSLTRVQPFFSELLDRDPTGREWLSQVLRVSPRSEVVRKELLEDPGELDARLVASSDGGRRNCFEYPVPPSISFLRWLLRNPDRLTWPKGSAGEFGAETTEWRRRLIDGTAEERAEAMDEGIRELDSGGVEGARRKPWAFEGWTSVDCCLETDRLILFVEGKRTEKLSASTAWFPVRNQLIRNLEVIEGLHPDKPGFVLLVTETAIDEPDERERAAAAPHLSPTELESLWNRYLGQVTWSRLCDATGVAFERLPDEVS